ncbi:helix-turn-helix domain-containing protein [Plantactinospora soyae]|uniref:Transcriptional regulator with XRE-family HTH domain n=1 Tax=Plantactinospora soyae TaxID=1544732 RepID=A0A927QWE3_9ACTN|nr:helix-turn-helix transcriptional regulator [Plantactinospora soyae]MBE1485447.1 transcriptional regulator with XRE-family HTH domain [Plantactinospora soyae]
MEMWIRALKAARASAEVSQERLAAMINYSPSTIAAIETGRRRPTMPFAMAADQALGTAGLLAELLAAANRQESPSWFAPWRSIEEQATRLRTFEPLLVPGLLQTEEYARAVLTGSGLHTPDEVERLLATRLERQALLTEEEPKLFTAIVDEGALRRVVSSRDIQRAQLGRLVELAAQPHIRLHVIPADAGGHAGMAGGFVLATLPDGDEVAHIDGVFGQVMDRPDAVGIVGRMWDVLLGEALPERASLELIEKLGSEL